MGPPDLDLRPAPLARWTLDQQIGCCPECGYCSADVSLAPPGASEVVRSETYRLALACEDHPELTRRYVCAALILSAEGDNAGAGRAALKGAWAADDLATRELGPDFDPDDEAGLAEFLEIAGRNEELRKAASTAAAHCRRLAIGYFEADRAYRLTFAADEESADAVLADLHRRVGDFDASRACARSGLARGAAGFVREVFEYQLWLDDLGDVACHNLGEVGAETGDPDPMGVPPLP
jgi:hypothetical protein